MCVCNVYVYICGYAMFVYMHACVYVSLYNFILRVPTYTV